MKKVNAIKMGLLSLALCSSACLAANTVEKRVYNDVDIYAFFPYLSDDFTQSLEQSLNTVAKNSNLNINIQSADNNTDNQISQIKEVIKNNSNKRITLLVDPVLIGSGEEIASMAKKANLPIVFFHRKPAESIFKDDNKVLFLGHNNEQAGKLQASLLQSYLKFHKDFDKNGNGKVDYILFKGDTSNYETDQRTMSFEEKLKRDHVDINKQYEKHCFWSRTNAKTSMEEAIKNVGLDNIEAIISNNDEMALGALEALNEHGYNLEGNTDKNKYIPIFGIDGTRQAISAVHKGILEGTVLLDERKMAKILVRIAIAKWNDIDITPKLVGVPMEDNELKIPYRVISKQQFIK